MPFSYTWRHFLGWLRNFLNFQAISSIQFSCIPQKLLPIDHKSFLSCQSPRTFESHPVFCRKSSMKIFCSHTVFRFSHGLIFDFLCFNYGRLRATKRGAQNEAGKKRTSSQTFVEEAAEASENSERKTHGEKGSKCPSSFSKPFIAKFRDTTIEPIKDWRSWPEVVQVCLATTGKKRVYEKD